MDSDLYDWQDTSFKVLAITFAGSIGLFVACYAVIHVHVKRTFAQKPKSLRSTADSRELVLIKKHTKVVRLLALLSFALQCQLLRFAKSSTAEGARMAFMRTLYRPAGGICIHFLGFATNSHSIYRVVYAVLSGLYLVIDCIDDVNIAMQMHCMNMEALTCGSEGVSNYSLSELRILHYRNLFSLMLYPWLLLELGLLIQSIGLVHSQYSNRQLSISRPSYNLRAALATYYPSKRMERPQYFRSS